MDARIEAVVYCSEEQEYDQLMEWCQANNYDWSGEKATYKSFWGRYPYLCICLRTSKQMTVGSMATFVSNADKYGPVIPFIDFMDERLPDEGLVDMEF